MDVLSATRPRSTHIKKIFDYTYQLQHIAFCCRRVVNANVISQTSLLGLWHKMILFSGKMNSLQQLSLQILMYSINSNSTARYFQGVCSPSSVKGASSWFLIRFIVDMLHTLWQLKPETAILISCIVKRSTVVRQLFQSFVTRVDGLHCSLS